MLNTNDYEILKQSLLEMECLFNKLRNISVEYKNLQYDESGFFNEGEETLKRHWMKLSSKILDHICTVLTEYECAFIKLYSFEEQSLYFSLSLDTEKTVFLIDYSKNGSISISQMS